MANLNKEIIQRRTFAIISHPDAGKTTLTEKLLLHGGAIQSAGTVKAKRGKQFATSDWMEIEKQRGISVTSSVLQFHYEGVSLNLIDTPGHKDFSEDTYRTLTAVDCVLMVIDAAKGVESQTRKLFEVCRMRQIPIVAFINKMDRPGREPLDLLDDIEKVLKIDCYPFYWPIGQGDRFRGVVDLLKNQSYLYEKDQNQNSNRHYKLEPTATESVKDLEAVLGQDDAEQLVEEIDLLRGAGIQFDQDRFLKGEVTPVFFGSALENFGVELLLERFVDLAPPPQPRQAATRDILPTEEKFSAFIFKIQANMDPSHRDRVAFMRVCSGMFQPGMKVHHVRTGKEQRLGRPTQFMAQDRQIIEKAFAGDIVGIHDPGVFRIGDSLSEGENLEFLGIPVFAPENFARVELKDPLKSKQLNKALAELSEEGVVQLFVSAARQEKILGVVGVLQFDVVKFRIEKEYNVRMEFVNLPFSLARWVHAEDPKILAQFLKDYQDQVCFDRHQSPVMLFQETWKLKTIREKYPALEFLATSKV